MPLALYKACERGDVEAALEELGAEGVDVNEEVKRAVASVRRVRKRQRRVGERIAGRGRNRPQSSSGESAEDYLTGSTPLHIACRGGFVKVVSALLQAEGIDVNRAMKDGWTSVHCLLLWASGRCAHAVKY